MTYLTVTAHPDDEILGFGGSTFVLSSKGHTIHNLILSGNVEVRENRPELLDLRNQSSEAQKVVGAQSPIFGNFPNLRFNLVPHIELVKFIEKYILSIKPDVIVTHHPYDLNNDHYHTSLACQAAFRIHQRKNLSPMKALYFMEVLSSTDWAFSQGSLHFRPDTFIEIGDQGVQKKLDALGHYEGVMRDFPHSRSENTIRSLATIRGSQAGLFYCEGFQTAFHHFS